MRLINITVKGDSKMWFNLYVAGNTEEELDKNIASELDFFSRHMNIPIEDFIVKKQ